MGPSVLGHERQQERERERERERELILLLLHIDHQTNKDIHREYAFAAEATRPPEPMGGVWDDVRMREGAYYK